MARERRTVRVARTVFDELDRVLDTERGPRGAPSVNDFLTIELLPIIEEFATRFDDLPEVISGRPDYRILIVTGVLVHALSVVGQLVSEDLIELLSIETDLGGE